MPRVSSNYDFIGEVNAALAANSQSPMTSGEEVTALSTWVKDSWVDAIEHIESEDSDLVTEYILQLDGNYLNTDDDSTFISPIAGDGVMGLSQLPSGIKTTIKNRNANNFFVYYGDCQDNLRAFVLKGATVYKFDSTVVGLNLMSAAKSAVKFYGAAYADPGNATDYTDDAIAIIDDFIETT